MKHCGVDNYARIRTASLAVVAVAFLVMALTSLMIMREVQAFGDKADRDRACAVHWIVYDLVVEAFDAVDRGSGFDDPEEALEDAFEQVGDRMEFLADQCMPDVMRESRGTSGWR